MIGADKAFKLVLSNTPLGPTENISISECPGRVLAKDILAERNDPPFPRVLKDGIAINFSQFTASHSFPIESLTRAGQTQATLQNNKKCIEVMTGCPLPLGADTVVMYEDTIDEDGVIKISKELALSRGDNVAPESSNHKVGELILKSGATIQSAQLGIIASQGESNVLVYRSPRITVITSGDEIVDLGDLLAPHQIRASNRYTAISELQGHGFHHITHVHIPDNKRQTELALKAALDSSDALILSGGVSKGKFDFIPETLNKLGVQKIFHKVKQRPGKPFWFGTTEQTIVFALPGNPISTLACLRRYAIPSLKKFSGIKLANNQRVKLSQNIDKIEKKTDFIPVSIEHRDDGSSWATPWGFNTSGHYSSLAASHGIIIIPEESIKVNKGDLLEFLPWGHQGVICS
ncbi:MAG: molybdopterin molybdotransferase MoeA [Bacteriovoracaceae bacterium]|nr:molybdopterin molybdotransferase MoeA [Bacteriovoracaceae bacterium]